MILLLIEFFPGIDNSWFQFAFVVEKLDDFFDITDSVYF